MKARREALIRFYNRIVRYGLGDFAERIALAPDIRLDGRYTESFFLDFSCKPNGEYLGWLKVKGVAPV